MLSEECELQRLIIPEELLDNNNDAYIYNYIIGLVRVTDSHG